jgi:hypothetical protein
MTEAIDQLLTQERAESIRAGSISREQLPGYLRTQFKVGDNMVTKFLIGLKWLATEGKDDALLAALPAERARASAGSKAKSTGGTKKPTQTLASSSLPPTPPPEAAHQEQPERIFVAPTAEANGSHNERNSSLLNSGTIQVHVDSGWNIENIRQTFRMLQMIERGELIPPSEGSIDDSPASPV